jgi:very-short-patch-repair endonuclease
VLIVDISGRPTSAVVSILVQMDGVSTPWWAVPSKGQVSYLRDVDPALLGIALDRLPAGAPVVLQFRPVVSDSFDALIELLLRELDTAAVKLFPRWLPGAERLDGYNGLGIEAVRTLAADMAARTSHFRLFLMDLAVRGLRDCADGSPAGIASSASRFPAEVRVAGLARVIAGAYDRDPLVVVIEVPEGLSAVDEHALVSAAEWIAGHGGLTVWLVGALLTDTDRVRMVSVLLPAEIRVLEAETAVTDPAVSQRSSDASRVETRLVSVLTYPPLSGVPRRDSPAETTLEKTLVLHEWARGRHWNMTYEWHILRENYRLDLFWPVEGVVVEVDGDDHRTKAKYAADRRRDVQLQQLGLDVLRFTNEQVLQDPRSVAAAIEKMLTSRRSDPQPLREMARNVGR